MTLTRRTFLKSSLAVSALAAVSPAFRFARAADGFIEITAGVSKEKLFQGEAPLSELWTYDSQTPGPEIRVKKGERVRVRLINKLEEPTTIHWHGIRIANAMDGVPGLTQEAVQPGASFEYDFTVPDAGSFWYHAHNKSWDQVARGLYGPLIVDEPEDIFDRAHDLTLVLDDWRLNRDGILDVESMGAMMDWSHAGRLGNWMTVNGKYPREYELNAGETYRLRLINAANARVMEIDPARFGATIAALDGQPLADPAITGKGTLLLGPAQRVDLLVTPEAGKDFTIYDVARGEFYAIVGFKVAGSGNQSVAEMPRLVPNALPEPDMAKARRVPLHMTGGAMGGFSGLVYKGKELGREDIRRTRQMWGLNGVANLGEKPLFSARRGETILVETVNDTAFNHAMHLHGHHFRVIERSESHPVKGEPWRDTFMVGPRQTVKIAFVADNPGKWLLHCHMLEHAAAGMNTWFEVT